MDKIYLSVKYLFEPKQLNLIKKTGIVGKILLITPVLSLNIQIKFVIWAIIIRIKTITEATKY